MSTWPTISKLSLVALAGLLLVGCARQDAFDQLRSDVSAMHSEIEALQQKIDENRDIATDSAAEARRAAQAAEQAAESSAAASERADRIYQESLRK